MTSPMATAASMGCCARARAWAGIRTPITAFWVKKASKAKHFRGHFEGGALAWMELKLKAALAACCWAEPPAAV
eukprot:CAMPEP_0173416008 /NCGR_PEP_ID=MMETSP1356-20130122/85168_1 /TAXON_ID=77927 ORGANISM="Hemiselmis virescens, Strain PCC157" /NCGR_SAMPLE_ID=MMETSP1356 /ASSEMBLY_ACC=CAM_ASM_000847 /LENGTH=73 /DNA_ID=CAMNT_0014378301 /DNA_START=1277 /DNA_END=1495 /DNA_ORIENTATION=+